MSTIQSKVTGEFVVRPAGKCSSSDIHVALFGTTKPGRANPTHVKAGIRKYVRRQPSRG
jgi:hypothetical protein